MSVRQVNRVGSYHNLIVLTDKGYESDSESYISLDLVMRCVLKISIPNSVDEVIQEFDRTRAQT